MNWAPQLRQAGAGRWQFVPTALLQPGCYHLDSNAACLFEHCSIDVRTPLFDQVIGELIYQNASDDVAALLMDENTRTFEETIGGLRKRASPC